MSKNKNKDDDSILGDYFKYQQEYESKYGEKTVVLIQIGSFYEIYEYDPNYNRNDDDDNVVRFNTSIGKAVELSSLLNVLLTRKNKSKELSKSNPYMIGFPCPSYDKNRDLLLANNYTIVRVDQEGKGNNVKRYVAEVLSPATDINGSLPTTNQIVSLYMECQKSSNRYEDYKIITGISTIDVSTGKNIVCEVYSKDDDNVHAIHEIYRFLTSHQPREILIYLNKFVNDVGQADGYIDFLRENLELNRYPSVIIKLNEVNKEYFKIDYQQHFLSKVFAPKKQPPQINATQSNSTETHQQKKVNNNIVINIQTNIIENLNLERMYYGTLSYILLLQYCYEHNELLIQKIQTPDTTWIDDDKHLILTHNAIVQLNLLPPGNQIQYSSKMDDNKYGKTPKSVDSLFSVVNNTSTTIGKRYLKNMLLNPINDIDELDKYYQMTEEILSTEGFIDTLDKHLKGIPDLEKYQRRLSLKIIKPHEFSILFKAYLRIIELYGAIVYTNTCHLKEILFKEADVHDFNSCISYVLSLIDLNKLETCKILDDRLDYTESFIWEKMDTTADTYQNNIRKYEDNLQKICEHLNTLLMSSRKVRGKLITLDLNPKRGRKNNKSNTRSPENDDDDEEDQDVCSIGQLVTTNHKASLLKSCRIDENLCGKLQFKTIKQQTIITSDKIELYGYELESNRNSLERHLFNRYNQLLDEINSRYNFFDSIVTFISLLDFVKSNAKTARKYNYYKPIIDRDADKSYFKVEGIRHPIVERLIDKEYVTNDLSLGKGDADNSPYGMLLYSLNGGGKSTTIKSIGLAIILAQAGLYVPGKLTYYPYNKIITRLSGHDDIFKGDSSFVVEMKELKTILKNSDEFSLNLLDELSRGSEIQSGAALTISSILHLVNKKSTFILSTHLHQLPDTSYIKDLKKNELRISHLTTTYDEETDNLIYDRKLKDGSGSTLYGLEVARWLKLEKTFIDKAYEVRRYLLDESQYLVNPKKSRYNSRVYVDECTICGTKSELETHHIEEQNKADENGFIGHFHKNEKFNLAVLCRNCHEWLHQNKKSLMKKDTSNGTMLVLN